MKGLLGRVTSTLGRSSTQGLDRTASNKANYGSTTCIRQDLLARYNYHYNSDHGAGGE